MKKYFFFWWLLFSLLITSGVASASPFPRNVTVEFSGPLKSSITLKFIQTGNRYQITSYIHTAIYRTRYESRGLLSNSLIWSQRFSEYRGNHLSSYTTFNPTQGQIIYGKIKKRKIISLNGQSLDIAALPWQIAINPSWHLKKVQITNGRSVYLLNGKGRFIQSFAQPKNIKSKQGYIKAFLYDLSSLRNYKNPIQFAYAPAYSNIPIYMKYTLAGHDFEFIVSKIWINGKKVF